MADLAAALRGERLERLAPVLTRGEELRQLGETITAATSVDLEGDPSPGTWVPEATRSTRPQHRFAGHLGERVDEATEIAKLKAEVDRLGGVIIEQAVELAVLRGKTSWG